MAAVRLREDALVAVEEIVAVTMGPASASRALTEPSHSGRTAQFISATTPSRLRPDRHRPALAAALERIEPDLVLAASNPMTASASALALRSRYLHWRR